MPDGIANKTDPKTTPRAQPKRGLIWLIFFAPGALMMLWQYLFPKIGDVFGSGRRLNSRFLQFVFTMGIYAFLFGMWLILTDRIGVPRANPTGTGVPSASQAISNAPQTGTPKR